jgi:hypothetical protein
VIKVWWENEGTGNSAHDPTMLDAIPRQGDLVTFDDDVQPGRNWRVSAVRWDVGGGADGSHEVVVVVYDPDYQPPTFGPQPRNVPEAPIDWR